MIRISGTRSFSIQALPPDRHYRIAAVEYVDEGELQDPEFLERLRDVGISFSLEPGARERVNLSVSDR